MLESVAMADIGKKRKLNQDVVYATMDTVGNLPNLFIVADGMGGHSGGELASKWSVETVLDIVKNSKHTEAEAIFEQAVQAANKTIRQRASESDVLHGMGTTLVMASIDENAVQVANVGDSRLYLAEPKKKSIRQITVDHSLVEEMIVGGRISREDARYHPDKHIITRAIGAKEWLTADFFRVELKGRELILMCSDGLSNMLRDDEMAKILHGKKSIVQKANDLIKAANDKGGSDNIAVILVSIG